MCHFITATLPGNVDLKKAGEVFACHKLRFEQIENESVRKHLEPGDLYILTTQGICDCGTALGSQYGEEDLSIDQKEKFRKQTIEKFKKKGWSATKIERWFKEEELTKGKELRIKESQHESAITFVSDWVNFIRDILIGGASKRIGLLLHMYDGPISGRILIAGKKRVPLKDLNEVILLEMREDMIYEFVQD